jgi:hypothetical protein
MLTLNQIITRIQNLVSSNVLLSNGSFFFGDPWEYTASQISGGMKYPFVGARLVSSAINGTNGNVFETNINLFFCDLVHKGEENETEVLSDMLKVCQMFYADLVDDLNDYDGTDVSLTSSMTPFTEKFDDEVSGIEMTITIQQFYNKSICP